MITTAAAEFLYDAVAQWKFNNFVAVDSTSFAFFKELYPAVETGTYYRGDAKSPFAKIMSSVTAYADSFVEVAEKYIPRNGSLSEQYNRDTGTPLSAYDLTWSYAAFVTMSQRRSGQYPTSWGSRLASPLPKSCAATSQPGVYTPATAAGAPNVTSLCQVNIVFDANATTYYGENVYVVGNTPELGAWDVNNALPMGAGEYTSSRPLWTVSAYLDAGETVHYKYVRQENCNQPYIYETINRTLTVPNCGGAGFTENDAWTGPVGESGNC